MGYAPAGHTGAQRRDGRDEIHPWLAEGAPGDRGDARGDSRGAHRSRARGGRCREPGGAPGGVHPRQGAGGRAAPRRGPAAGVQGGNRRGAAADHLRGAERAGGDHRGGGQARRLRAGDRHDDRGGQDPRRRELRHDGVGARAGAVRRARRDHRAAVGRRRAEVRRLAGRKRPCQGRPGHRDRDHPEPARCPGRARDRPRPGRARAGAADPARGRAGGGHLPLPACGDHRRGHPGAVPGVLWPADPRGEERAVARVVAAAASCDRAAADLGAGGRDQPDDLRHEPAAARVRRGQGEGRVARAPLCRGRDARRAGREDLCLRAGNDRHLGRGRTGEHRRRDGRARDRVHGGHGERVRRGGLFRPGAHRTYGPRAQDQLGCALPFRARHRPGLDAARAGGGDVADPGAVRGRGVGSRGRGRCA